MKSGKVIQFFFIIMTSTVFYHHIRRSPQVTNYNCHFVYAYVSIKKNCTATVRYAIVHREVSFRKEKEILNVSSLSNLKNIFFQHQCDKA